jgi:TolA-binding protein
MSRKLWFVALSSLAVACAAQSASAAEKDVAKAPATHGQMDAMQSQMQAMRGQMDAMQEQMRAMAGQMQEMREMHTQMQQNMRGMMSQGGAQPKPEAKPETKPDAPAGGDHAAHH